MRGLAFSPPRLVTDATNSSGPWWGGVVALSETHALGYVPTRTIATTDGGHTWMTLSGWEDDSREFGGLIGRAKASSFHNDGADHVFISPTGKNANVTGVTSAKTIRFAIGPDGNFSRATDQAFSISGLPHLHGFRVGAASASMWLRDGTMLATSVTSGVGTARAGYLSVVTLRSRDGYKWSFGGVVASADEVPYAHEGPSENALAYLANGSLLCVMRVEGESGHHSPYISKVSDDEGRSWKHLRSLRAWPGADLAPGCVRPRLASLNGSLVLAGGRPSPTSHDILVWLNEKGDGDEWRPFSISYWHNRLSPNASWRMPTFNINVSRRLPRYTTSYTSLVQTAPSAAYLVYGAGPHGFAMPMRLSSDS